MSDDDLYIEELVAIAPPLTASQRNQIGALLSAHRAEQAAPCLQSAA